MSNISLEDAVKQIPTTATMRDIFDFCQKWNLENLAQGMIELSPPEKLRKITSDLILEDSDVHSYRNRMGENEYRESLLKISKVHYGIQNLTIDNIFATSGVSGAIYSTLVTLHKQGKDKIAVTNPFYTYHEKQVMEITGKKPWYLPLAKNEDWTPDFEKLEQFLKDGLNAIIVCNPGNPSGAVLTKEQMSKYVELTHKYQCYLIFDEIYCDLIWPPHKLQSMANTFNVQDYPYVITCRGFSKNLGCQSWRLGYIISNSNTISKLMATHDPIYISVPVQQHSLGRYLTQHSDDYAEHIEKESVMMRNNLETLSVALEKVFGWKLIRPRGSMYAMFHHNSESDLAAVLLGLQKGIGVAPGSMFFEGNPLNSGLIRIHLGITEEKAKRIANSLTK
eukprot:TRINITY_DN12129_c1_g1_i1.p1 TRINITY_DN12129_c1_g1~~TRINITY_DN12129_c1_g1_i1.p1  ORF type:complete len:400 (-),score=99.87 TRINITY_DN12129_c1_g1_i1:166-1344(-)